ncbi:uncharacterized protein SPSK_07899 [Sporothrix schenckii 1099-18]|uniref:Uncharacterized protein n=1 Tax=Sporothrix schenckii 1099-18 TaxID=1397361 RepID=A0A0F2MDU0_SPOSC|nr:uncharacterized protein SPSK_07899 [Sporothrix schenckii 1099-18]KJR87812.1 hypothetical protein SPSK_07899 [Sporothrix schenckii 1099-18]
MTPPIDTTSDGHLQYTTMPVEAMAVQRSQLSTCTNKAVLMQPDAIPRFADSFHCVPLSLLNLMAGRQSNVAICNPTGYSTDSSLETSNLASLIRPGMTQAWSQSIAKVLPIPHPTYPCPLPPATSYTGGPSQINSLVTTLVAGAAKLCDTCGWERQSQHKLTGVFARLTFCRTTGASKIRYRLNVQRIASSPFVKKQKDMGSKETTLISVDRGASRAKSRYFNRRVDWLTFGVYWWCRKALEVPVQPIRTGSH